MNVAENERKNKCLITFPATFIERIDPSKAQDVSWRWNCSEQKLWISADPHRFAACILNSSDLCLSPTYSLLGSHSCGAAPGWRLVIIDTDAMTGVMLAWRMTPGIRDWRCSSAGVAAGPASRSYGGCSSTQHPRAALWPPLSSWSNSENNGNCSINHRQNPSKYNLYKNYLRFHGRSIVSTLYYIDQQFQKMKEYDQTKCVIVKIDYPNKEPLNINLDNCDCPKAMGERRPPPSFGSLGLGSWQIKGQSPSGI